MQARIRRARPGAAERVVLMGIAETWVKRRVEAMRVMERNCMVGVVSGWIGGLV